jgi:hypothetical protein
MLRQRRNGQLDLSANEGYYWQVSSSTETSLVTFVLDIDGLEVVLWLVADCGIEDGDEERARVESAMSKIEGDGPC